ncbi:hypothetical protein CsatA_004507 [Cannabis sativa]
MMNKRIRRVRLLQTYKSPHHDLDFVRNYLSHLVPALRKINNQNSSSFCLCDEENGVNHNKLAKAVRFEVDMAFALSAKEFYFAWSHALEAKLIIQRDISVNNYNNKNTNNNNDSTYQRYSSLHQISFTNNFKSGEISSTSGEVKMTMMMKKKRKLSRRRERKGTVAMKSSEEEDINIVGDRLARLRTLLPGGNEIILGESDDNQLLTQVASYIGCLQLQVNALKCLVELSHQ